VNKTFGKWTVIKRARDNRAGKSRWLCRCSCGTQRVVLGPSLLYGRSLSCGCSRSGRGRLDHQNRTHGLSNTPTYNSWLSMRSRCTNRKEGCFRYYGGRGIRVCRRWDKFENFLADMGQRPKGTLLDRKNNNRNYSPSNCRWVNSTVSMRNRRSCRMILFRGERRCISEWAEIIGISAQTLFSRFRYGWTVNRALSNLTKRQRSAVP
jgi:hypothetical protein